MPGSGRRTTSAEVAVRAGVSRTTVSFVLNDVQDQGISAATRARVLQAARELGYTPNAAARTLAGQASGTVAVVIPKAAHLHDDIFIGQFVASVNEACHRTGLKLLVESNEEVGREPGEFVKLVQSRRIDGLMVINLRRSEHAHLHRLRAAGIPMVLLGCNEPGTQMFYSVGNDTRVSASKAVAHLTALGHRRIAMVNFAQPEFLSVNEREAGWRDALAAVGVDADPSWVVHGDISVESGWHATRELLGRRTDCTALFAGNDTIAFGALKALREAGLRVPQDVAVIGFDDIPLAAYANPALTTMRTDAAGHGLAAMRMLETLLHGERPAETHVECVAELMVRESCGARSGL